MYASTSAPPSRPGPILPRALPNLLLIRGLGHSGSTILDLVLGSHPAIVGLGEAMRILKRPLQGEEARGPAQLRQELRHTRLCTCGLPAVDCPVWGPILEWLPINDERPLAQKLERLLRLLPAEGRQTAGPGNADPVPLSWAVDSDQGDLEAPFLAWPHGEIRLLFLVRDARSWTHSRCSAEKRGGLDGWRTLARWVRVNRRIEAALRRTERPVFVLGYEELALAPEAVLPRLCQWLGLPFDAAMLTPGAASRSHILSGNHMRHEVERRSLIRYDAGWLSSPYGPSRLALLHPRVAGMHRRLVYGNRVL